MKKILVIIVVILLIGVGIYIYLNYTSAQALSVEQQKIVDTFGYPQQFTISYLPQGNTETTQLARTETWLYPEHQKSITFIAGKIYSVDELEATTGTMTYSDLKPEVFDFSMNYDDIAEIVGADTIEPVEIAPELNTEGQLQTYVADHLVFTIESNHLTFLQTLGIESK